MMSKNGEPEDGRLAFPLDESKVAVDEDGKRFLEYHRTLHYFFLKELADALLEAAEEEDEAKHEDEYSHTLAVILLLVASLECFVNDMLIQLARRKFGADYKPVADGFLGGSLRSRILRIVPIASSCTKRLDQGHHQMGCVFELIKVRNRIAHTVEYYCEDVSFDEVIAEQDDYRAVTRETCSRYSEAVRAFLAAVLGGMMVLEGNRPWDNDLIIDAGQGGKLPSQQDE
jgi:hypothetical protein